MPTPPPPEPAQGPESLLAEFLALRERGAAPTFDEWCSAHSAHAPALRELLARFERARAALNAADGRAAASSKEHGGSTPSSAPTDELVRRLKQHAPGISRYRPEGELARGGMGAILRVWDGDLRRHLAMKVILAREMPDDGAQDVELRQLGRFLEEAQVTAQLDHPGIVPVHELGLDSGGRVYFTMKLVHGRDLKAIFELVFSEQEGWNRTRALSVILKACEAMAYAHAKGVIHRDLKPANVMVGNFGEVYVMDWGLARVLGRKDAHDIRLAPAVPAALSSVRTERRETREEFTDSPLVTLDGDVMGTPAYMAPEQARGEIEKLGPRSDVYSMGALLYHLLAGHAPYLPPGVRASNRTVLAMVLQGPPAALSSISRDVAPELEAICEKAMAREASQRYPDTLALAEDLRAFLEHRVVGAYETGAWAEARKWVRRNRPFAIALASALVLLVAGLTTSLVFKARADARADELLAANTTIQAKSSELETKNAALDAATRTARAEEQSAREQEALAKTEEAKARAEKANVLKLSAFQTLDDLTREADESWPASPALLPQYHAWMSRAQALVARLPEFRAAIVELERHAAALRAEPPPAAANAQLESPGERILAADDAGGEVNDRWWHAQMQKLVAALEAFEEPRTGLMHGLSEAHGWSIGRRLEFAASVEERSVSGSAAQARWREALAAISTSPHYADVSWPGGATLAPQLGLLPLGADPQSGLWEFAHLQSGLPAVRGTDGRLRLEEQTGLVFVLIPGGTFWMGAQKTDPNGRNFDPRANDDESPVHQVRLSPYFLSKYELTQGQWERFTGVNPSQYKPSNYLSSWNRAGKAGSLLHPVEQVSWRSSMAVMSRMGCSLPTEAQWENGCRAGTSSIYWCGNGIEGLGEVANVADSFGKANGGAAWPIWDKEVDDGNCLHAEVGSYRANAYGLHDVHGNVWEWCADGHGAYEGGLQIDPLAAWEGAATRVLRGGSFNYAAASARSANHNAMAPDSQTNGLGLRPARAVEPGTATQGAGAR